MYRPHTNQRRRVTTAAALTALFALAVGACGSDDTTGSDSSSPLQASADTTALATPATEPPAPVTQPPVIESTPPTEPVGAHDRAGPVVTHLATIGTDDFVSGSTSGPDGAVYVTDGSNGEVLRIDRRDGAVSTIATGLPQKAFQGQDIGGPVDIASSVRRPTCSSRS